MHLFLGPFCFIFDNNCDKRFLAWQSASVKTWENSPAAGISTGSASGNYLKRRQQHLELESDDIVLIQNTTDT